MMHIDEARKIDPMITGQDGSEVLFSPNTAVVDIHACLRSVNQQVSDTNPNYKLHYGQHFLKQIPDKKEIVTASGDTFEYGHLINSTG
jgi:L-2-hydroxyglutarate oxidase